MDWLSEHAWQAWLSATLLLGMAEMLSLDLVLAMLAAGAAVGMVAALIGAPGFLQVLLAVGAAVAALAVVRPGAVRRLRQGPELKLGHGKLVGQQGIVVEPMSGIETGRIKLAGEIWSARPYDETLEIAAGATVDVLEIRGATALVHPVPELEN